MKRFDKWLVWMVALVVAGCSCAGEAQELSSFWEGHDFKSLEAFDDIDAAEEKFDGYISLLSKAPHRKAVQNMRDFLDSAAQNTVAYMVWASWFEPYLHALESPYRNDDLFVVWLDKVLEDRIIDDGSMMDHLQHMRIMMEKNTVGSYPQELALRTENGGELKLSELRGERMLMLFVDADCPSCLEALEENAREYEGKDVRLLAVLVNGSEFHLENIERQLPESVLAPWTIAWCNARRMENESFYDRSLLPFRILVDADGIIEKSYH